MIEYVLKDTWAMPTYFAVRYMFTKLHLSHLKIFLLSAIELQVHAVKQNFIRLVLMGIIFCKFVYFLQFCFPKKSQGQKHCWLLPLTAMKM